MNRKYIWLIGVIWAVGCKKPYNPPAISSSGSYLVVEGVINAGADSTVIVLSRTVNLSSANTVNPVSGAAVTVQSDQNLSFPLAETSAGRYVSAGGLNLDNSHKYRLYITTSDSKQYQSAFEAVTITPPIDSIGFTVQNLASGTGMQLYVNTHDASNNTKYYRWDYAETWQFHALYQSSFITNGTAIVPRTQAQMTYTCYKTDTSTSIILGSSAKLSQNVIYQSPLTQILSTSEKIETEYSILVNQYALTGDAYSFWTNLKTNTEQLGSIFDAQPSQISGNITCVTNPAETVVGYISVCTVQHKRVFIYNSRFPESWRPVYPYECRLDSLWYALPKSGPPPLNQVATQLIPINSGIIPVYAFYVDGSIEPVGYISADVDCTDCTLRGSITPPSFWR